MASNDEQRRELEPCPFCGGEGSISEMSEHRISGVSFVVGCDNEECDLQFPGCDTKKLATQIWNRRTLSPSVVHRIERAFADRYVSELTNTLELMHDCEDEGICDVCQTIIYAKDIAEKMQEENG